MGPPVLAVICCLLLTPYPALAGAVINETLFDPSGTDTGLEKIEIFNPDAAAVDLSGWEIYPDGIGYFSFPSGFSLGPRSFVTIHLRSAGINDASNLFHSAPGQNMSNSSGSIALFRPGHGSDTIADFMRYHKSGSAERKTWESAASSAGLWSAGTSVDISGLPEGNSIGLANDGVRSGAGSWQVFALPSPGGTNAAASATVTPQAPLPAPPVPAQPPVPSLGAYAGHDISTVAGSVVGFHGVAFGLDDKPLDGARYLWNFGDGSTGDGQSPDHIFHFSGTYYVNLAVQSGHYAGSDWLIVTVLPAELSISEIKPGDDGFVELANASAARVDIGGMSLTDGSKAVFRIPVSTFIGPGGVLVLPGENTRLNPVTYLGLKDARGVVLDDVSFTSPLPSGSSWEWDGRGFKSISRSTPGSISGLVLPRTIMEQPADETRPAVLPRRTVLPEAATNQLQTEPLTPVLRPEAAQASASGAIRHVFLGASVILGLATAAGVIILKRADKGLGQ